MLYSEPFHGLIYTELPFGEFRRFTGMIIVDITIKKKEIITFTQNISSAMKKSFLICTSLLLLGLFFTQCSGDKYNPDMFKPDSHGDPGKVLVILEKDFWGGALESAIMDKFQKPIETLPQPEPLFSLAIADRKAFTPGLKTLHTIVIFEINDKANNRNARMEEPSKDIWAKGQTVYKFRASNQKVALQLFEQHSIELVKKLNESSRKKLMSDFKSKKNKPVAKKLSEVQKVDLTVPAAVVIQENINGFAWLKQFRTEWENNAEHEIQQGILVYTYPYVDDSTFTYDFQVAKRDSILKYSVPGPSEGSYMATELTKGLAPEFSEKLHNGSYLFELRGMWKVEGDLMGGPFVSISTFDEPNNRIVTIEGYVYAPHFEKRELLRELEAMIYSFKFST